MSVAQMRRYQFSKAMNTIHVFIGSARGIVVRAMQLIKGWSDATAICSPGSTPMIFWRQTHCNMLLLLGCPLVAQYFSMVLHDLSIRLVLILDIVPHNLPE